MHGLAGSAAVVLLVLAQTRDAWWGVAYLLLFVLGAGAGMLIVTSAFALPLLRTRRLPRLDAGIRIAASVSSLGLGGYLAWSVGAAGVHAAAGLR
ncbi:MAG: hypothetical protein OEW98_12115 [Betaproteobacteria bacterium]|nr:hypothetical protein [Betaproteobacteria bacterium]